MAGLSDLIRHGRLVEAHWPWPRAVVDAPTWRELAEALALGETTLLSLWGDVGAVHMALLDEARSEIAVATLECPGGRFPSVGALHPPAVRLERTIRDLFGLQPDGTTDLRPWLDHGRWGLAYPPLEGEGRIAGGDPGWGETIRDGDTVTPTRTASPSDLPLAGGGAGQTRAYQFLPAEGENLHQIPVGPVHAGIIEPGHFRFTANGETVVRLEARLGYVHKGIDGLMAGASVDAGARLAGRTSGDSTVAYAIAFSRAVEAALGLEAPARGAWLRALMAELERIANHLGDIGAICNDASFVIMHTETGILREHVLRTAHACFGHRLMRDCVMPGGVAVDFDKRGAQAVHALVDRLRARFPALVALYDNTASLQDRTVSTGILKPELARLYGAGGHVGRASGRAFDARRTPGYAPYDRLSFEVPVLGEGDVNARVWIRIREIEQSLGLVEQILRGLPGGPVRAPMSDISSAGSREGMALAEAFRGDVLAWVRLDGAARIARCHLRDPSWFQWPLLEAAIEGNIVADFPLCNKSFNCSYSGHDI